VKDFIHNCKTWTFVIRNCSSNKQG